MKKHIFREYVEEERRTKERDFIEPYDTGTFLEFTLEGKKYRFNLLDTSPGGMSMLVMDGDVGVLERIKIGDKIKMKYSTSEASLSMDFELRHITPIKRGTFKGHYQVGLYLIPHPG